jgi:hypothetical protein
LKPPNFREERFKEVDETRRQADERINKKVSCLVEILSFVSYRKSEFKIADLLAAALE